MFNYALRVWPWGAASYSLSPASCTSQAPRRHSAGPKAQDHLRSAADSDLDSDSDLTRPLMLSTRGALKKKNLISFSPSWSKISVVVNPGVDGHLSHNMVRPDGPLGGSSDLHRCGKFRDGFWEHSSKPRHRSARYTLYKHTAMRASNDEHPPDYWEA